RWYMAVGGTSLSVLSLFCNSLIAIVLIRSKHSHFFFFALLAISDTFLSLMYGPVIAMEIIKDVIREVWLNRTFWNYMPALLTLCNVSMTFSTFLIILATVERYMITEKSERLRWFRSHRGLLAFIAFVFACLLKGFMFWEFVMLPNEPCQGTLMERELSLTALSENLIYSKVVKFYVRNIFTVLIPFFYLIILNILIVLTLRRQQRAAAMFRFATSRHKANCASIHILQLKVRSATRLTVLIVCSYLISNALNVAITIAEYVDYGWLTNETNYPAYEFTTDFTSVLYIFVCATRLIVYVTCNEEIRNEVIAFLCGMSSYNRKGFRKQSNSAPKGAASELDSIALTIARRFIGTDLASAVDAVRTTEENDNEPLDAKSRAVVIANGYTLCTSDEV
ncbi:hypothetical protein PFISCL1PPCAC_7118, partial [Pristionchus fissidentatus]